ncbi:MAG TPA: FAD-dependent oxidoreductase [Actinokineospora sp.]|jgi:NADPH-dependent 2,4-dienoyl-CoA reductase/sulfur reductase-like enzyme|nr:FAD-dependent oxidoreductase [Actinokineospora sp.]
MAAWLEGVGAARCWRRDLPARKHGADVTVIDPLPMPLHKTLGDTVVEVFRDLRAANGVTWRLGVGVSAFARANGVVDARHLSDGTVIPADVVLVGVGGPRRGWGWARPQGWSCRTR